jgi:hypothetical protein
MAEQDSAWTAATEQVRAAGQAQVRLAARYDTAKGTHSEFAGYARLRRAVDRTADAQRRADFLEGQMLDA